MIAAGLWNRPGNVEHRSTGAKYLLNRRSEMVFCNSFGILGACSHVVTATAMDLAAYPKHQWLLGEMFAPVTDVIAFRYCLSS